MNKIRLGLSCTTIEPRVSGPHLDGIGVYTKKLLQHFSRVSALEVYPLSYSRFLKATPTSVYPNGKFFARSFTTSSLYSLLTNRQMLTADVDIFHATDYRIPKLDCPVVATLHDAIPLQHPHWVNLRWRNIKNYIMRSSVRWANHIIADSNAVVPDLIEYYGVSEKNISVVHLGVDALWLESVESKIVQAVLQQYQLTPGYFLFVGTLQPRKNILRILQAYQALPSSIRQEKKLVIVGKVGWRMEHAMQLMESLIQKGDVVWLQNIETEITLRAIYQNAGIFVFPSLYEGFGLPVLEAFASRVPVIISTVSALPEIAEGAALEVDPYSVDAITHAMQTLVEDHELRESYIAKGLIKAREKSWEKCADETLKVYQKLL